MIRIFNKVLSIRRMTRLIPLLMLVLIIINISSILIIVLNYRIMNIEDDKTSAYFRKFNNYILSVSNSGSIPDTGIIEQFESTEKLFLQLRASVKHGVLLEEPLYGTLIEKESYLSLLREHARIVRSNASEMINSSYKLMGIMLAISVAAGIFMFAIIFTARKAISIYGTELEQGLQYIEKILTFEAVPDYVKISSRIKEVDELGTAISSLSEDISYNRKLIDTAFHGNLDMIMNEIYKSIRTRMPCDRIALAFLDSEENVIAETAVTSYNSRKLRSGFMEPMKNTSLNILALTGEGRIINDLRAYASNNKISESTGLLLEEGVISSITVPMMFDGKCLGFFFASSKEQDAYTEKSLHYVSRVINLMKQKFYIEYLLQEVIAETSNSFVGLMEEKDNETSDHILRMAHYSHITARIYHEIIEPLHPRFMREILWFSPLHDIGKVGIPDSILLKEGPLTPEQKIRMEGHVTSGVRVIEKMNARLQKLVSAPLMQTAVDIISGHHEKFNGEGYPEGLSGTAIPLAGRIAAVADVFDALTSRRPYKEAYTVEEALDIMENEMSGSFDPDVIKAFKTGMPEISRIYNRYKEI